MLNAAGLRPAVRDADFGIRPFFNRFHRFARIIGIAFHEGFVHQKANFDAALGRGFHGTQHAVQTRMRHGLNIELTHVDRLPSLADHIHPDRFRFGKIGAAKFGFRGKGFDELDLGDRIGCIRQSRAADEQRQKKGHKTCESKDSHGSTCHDTDARASLLISSGRRMIQRRAAVPSSGFSPPSISQ